MPAMGQGFVEHFADGYEAVLELAGSNKSGFNERLGERSRILLWRVTRTMWLFLGLGVWVMTTTTSLWSRSLVKPIAMAMTMTMRTTRKTIYPRQVNSFLYCTVGQALLTTVRTAIRHDGGEIHCT
ncbi:hypothetical protein P175DRAFT_0537823 [Aspergillus ochraceoroseus IBT 24754]|uniref:Uncharacterized protein n=1 Tax=Aspergillus ochraceoroseus IBT 24754 TaxID=1392256 RepID=A0A2T5M6L9_9EURO|nr:uncharacterized protein P175DRAFT_0537823 [Aspergillus ochraceoroseus IBT 24754]PTU24185.1 hypothetical protein P175DRAFT_0537823 [Aspergillus ochraceoroseus IBT 24754]